MKSFIGMSYLVKRGRILLREDLKKKKTQVKEALLIKELSPKLKRDSSLDIRKKKKSQVKEALLIKELSPKLKRDSSLDLSPLYGALIWSRGLQSSRRWFLFFFV